MLTRIEALEEDCKTKSISLQRSLLTSTESDRIIEELNLKYLESNNELTTNREKISEYELKVSLLEKELKSRELDITTLKDEILKIKEIETTLGMLENKNKDLEMLQREGEKTIEETTALLIACKQQKRELESKYEDVKLKANFLFEIINMNLKKAF